MAQSRYRGTFIKCPAKQADQSRALESNFRTAGPVASPGFHREEVNRMRKLGFVTLSSFVLALLALSLGTSRAGATATIVCNGLTPTIIGSGVINGTSHDDVIVGSSGNDTINGGAGNDTICGEGGDDVIDGGSGNDQMWGEAFRTDPLIGVAGNDQIKGGSGGDLLVDPTGTGQTLDGGSGVDTIAGFGVLLGGSGADSIRVLGQHAEPSTLNGGSGNDTCTRGNAQDVLTSCEIVP